MSQEYDNTNSGVLFPAEDVKVLRKGPVDIEGKERDMMITQSTTRTGKQIFEVWQKAGPIFVNEKRSEKDADMSGSVETEHGEYKIWGRKRTSSRTGAPLTSVSLAPAQKPTGGGFNDSQYANDYRDKKASGLPESYNDDPSPSVPPQAGGMDFEDDIPF